MGKQTTYINWDDNQFYIEILLNENRFAECALLLIGTCVGLRFKDLRLLKWGQVLSGEFSIQESKNKNKRVITIPNGAMPKIEKLYQGLRVQRGHTLMSYIFSNKQGEPYTIAYARELLKGVRNKFSIPHAISPHSLRKTYGRRIYDLNPGEHSLILLNSVFGHRRFSDTILYLGIRQEEIKELTKNMYN